MIVRTCLIPQRMLGKPGMAALLHLSTFGWAKEQFIWVFCVLCVCKASINKLVTAACDVNTNTGRRLETKFQQLSTFPKSCLATAASCLWQRFQKVRIELQLFKLDPTQWTWHHLPQMQNSLIEEFMDDELQLDGFSCISADDKSSIYAVRGITNVFDIRHCEWHSLKEPKSRNHKICSPCNRCKSNIPRQ